MEAVTDGRLSEQEIMRGLQRVPALSVTVSQLMELTAREDAGDAEVARAVGLDPVLSARMLRVANSPFFGVAGGVTSINHACMVLGMNTIRNLALAVGFADSLNFAESSQVQSELWHRSVATAFASQALARRCGESSDTAFTAGMLYNLGKLVMFAGFPEACREVYTIHQQQGQALADAERAVFGMTHRELGHLLAKQWQLPLLIQQVVAGVLDEDEPDPVMDMLYLANLVTNNGEPSDVEALTQGRPGECSERLQLRSEALTAWLDEVAKQRDMVASLV